MPDERIHKPMVLIPGSEFYMGPAAPSRGKPPGRLQWVESFYMDITPVTNAEYGAAVPEWTWDPALADVPVTGLSLEEIGQYCNIVGSRLPTEAEWEKAARGDRDHRIYPWGDRFSTSRCNCRRCFFLVRASLASVHAFPTGKSPWGCLDMAGNAWEWTSSSPDSTHFILKGGSCTSPSRDYLSISARLIEHHQRITMTYGFRCARSAP